ncbi:MAG: Hpt domain-containing protein [Candidatus Omnitrophica bacterium]|nr:Hpt domain-containing protein [Candidatus Omnitrophota bacterium]
MSEIIIDVPELMERVQDDKELILELFDIFLEDYEKRRVTLEGAVKENNFDEIGAVSHSLKGAAGNISAKPLRMVLMELENKGKANDLNGVPELISAMDEAIVLLKQRIGELRVELSG